jgi:hypothetical protein
VKTSDFPDLLREVASAPPVRPKPLARQETIPADPGELAASQAVPAPISEKSPSGDLPWLPSPEEMAQGAMATAPRALNTDNQKTVKAPPDYERQIAAMVEEAAREREIGNLSRRVHRLERILYAVLPNLLLIPQFLAKQRAVVTKATELLRRALIEEQRAKSQGVGAAGAPEKKEG